MTFEAGYSLARDEELEDLDLGGGSALSLKVAGRQSHGLVTVLEGIVHWGGPPPHLHDAEDEVSSC